MSSWKRSINSVAFMGALSAADVISAAQTAKGDSGGLEEVVVTAERRAEKLQTVPIAVTALTVQQLDDAGATSMSSLNAVVPSLVVQQEESGIDIFLRGLGQSTSQIGVEGSVSVYIDGVYIANAFAGLFSFNNIERLEVLKGPQGTLFGRNATGGVIQIVTKDPQQTPAFDGYISYGRFNTLDTAVYATTGITDNLAVDIAIHAIDQIDGYGRDVFSGQEIGNDKEISARSKMLFTPSNNWLIKLSGDYTANKYDVALGIPPGSIGLDGKPGYVGFFNSEQGRKDESHGYFWGLSATIEGDFSYGRLVGITSLRDSAVNYTVDEDSTPLPVVLAEPIYGRERTFTEEFQIQSHENSKVNWIAGAFYMHDKAGYEPVVINGLAVSPLNALSTFSLTKLDSVAGFGQATVEVLDDTHFTAGFRYTFDRRSITGSTTGYVGIGGYPIGTPLNLTSSPSAQSVTFQRPSWRLSLDHQFTPDILGYVSYNRGFKSGFYNTVSYSFPAVKPETVDAYETGIKAEFFHHTLRLNAAAYIYKVKQMQLPKAVAGSTFFLNAAAATIKGVDMDFEALPVDNVKIFGGVAYTRGRYSSFPDAPLFTPTGTGGNILTSFDAAGRTTLHTPEWTANVTAAYTILSPEGTFEPSISYSYSSSFCWVVDCRITQKSYFLLNSSVSWTSTSEHWGLVLWVKNLNDARYYRWADEITTDDVFLPALPRTYGITLKAHF